MSKGGYISQENEVVRPGQDCYFYYYSTCVRGSSCPFRHEPAALTNETVCTYWQAGNCSKPRCIFRHLEVTNKKRKVTSCYWESSPQGCTKPHCPFLHSFPKDPVQQPLPETADKVVPSQHHRSVQPKLDSGSIIVNPAKLERLQQLLSQENSVVVEDGGRGESGVTKRMVVPPGAAQIARRAITGGIKARLGSVGADNVKSRLGVKKVDMEKEDELYNSEEERLRKFAIKSIDLRARIDAKDTPGRRVVESDSDNESIDRIVKHKLRKKEKKMIREKLLEREEKLRKKMKKKDKKARLKSRISSVSLDQTTLLPSASDYSDLDSPQGSPDPTLLSVMSRTEKAGSLRSDLMLSRGGAVSARHRLGKVVRKEEQGVRKVIRRRDKRDGYAARVLGDLRIAREERRDRISRRVGSPIEITEEESDILRSVKKKKRSRDESGSPLKSRIRKVKESKLSKLIKKSQEGVTDNEKNSEIAGVSKRKKREYTSDEEVLKLKKSKGRRDYGGVDTSQDTRLDTSTGDVIKELDEFINE